jgi:hypothetical protein
MDQANSTSGVRASWFIVVFAGFVIVLDTAVILIHSFTKLCDASPVVLAISSSLFASVSTILHSGRVNTIRHVQDGSFPHVRRVLVVALLVASTLNIVFTILLA